MSELFNNVNSNDFVSKTKLQDCIKSLGTKNDIGDLDFFKNIPMGSSISFNAEDALEALSAAQEENKRQKISIDEIDGENFPEVSKNDWIESHEEYMTDILLCQYLAGNISDENLEILKQNATEEQANIMAINEDAKVKSEDEDKIEYLKDSIGRMNAISKYLDGNPNTKFAVYLGMFISGNMSKKDMTIWVQSNNSKSAANYIQQLIGMDQYLECLKAEQITSKAATKGKKPPQS